MRFLIKCKKEIKYNNIYFDKGSTFEIEKVSDRYIYLSQGIYKIKVLLKDYEELFYDKFV